MTKPLPLSDFRAVRHVLAEHEYAIGGEEVQPSDLIEHDVWDGIMHLPDDVAVRISNHHGRQLRFLYSLWCDWIEAVGDPSHPDNLFGAMLDAHDCFQCTVFDFLHGYYRSALSNLRSALELVIAGVYGNLRPNDPEFDRWMKGEVSWAFPSCRRRLEKVVSKEIRWLVKQDSWPEQLYYDLCRYAHSRPDASDGMLWQSNGPVYNEAAINLTFELSLSAYATGYLLTKIGRPDFQLADSSRVIFERQLFPTHNQMHKAFGQLRLSMPPVNEGD